MCIRDSKIIALLRKFGFDQNTLKDEDIEFDDCLQETVTESYLKQEFLSSEAFHGITIKEELDEADAKFILKTQLQSDKHKPSQDLSICDVTLACDDTSIKTCISNFDICVKNVVEDKIVMKVEF